MELLRVFAPLLDVAVFTELISEHLACGSVGLLDPTAPSFGGGDERYDCAVLEFADPLDGAVYRTCLRGEREDYSERNGGDRHGDPLHRGPPFRRKVRAYPLFLVTCKVSSVTTRGGSYQHERTHTG